MTNIFVWLACTGNLNERSLNRYNSANAPAHQANIAIHKPRPISAMAANANLMLNALSDLRKALSDMAGCQSILLT